MIIIRISAKKLHVIVLKSYLFEVTVHKERVKMLEDHKNNLHIPDIFKKCACVTFYNLFKEKVEIHV